TNMNDPSSIGPGMAVALLTTFYGAFMANVFFLPMAEKLKTRSKDEVQKMELVVEGIMSIKSGDTPRVVEEKLKSFLAPTERMLLEKRKEQA
ncbi:motility protein A, partial [bacterium]